MKKIAPFFLGLLLISIGGCNTSAENSDTNFPELRGPYLGQALPDTLPEIFAPGIIGTGMFTRDIAMTPEGDELYFCVALGSYTFSTILFTKIENGVWTKPEVVPFATDGKIIDFEPALSPDGNRLYFLSARPDGDEEAGDQDIWYVDRTEDGWSQPINPGEPLNTDGGEFFPSLTNDGYIYFTRTAPGSALNQIYRSKITDGKFMEAELLPEQVNSGRNQFNAFVARDHSYIIVPVAGRPESFDGVDYYISFRNSDDQWSQPINMGPEVNKDNTRGWSPYISPDGRYFFFMSNKSAEIPANELNYEKIVSMYHSPGNGNSTVYWMKADFLQNLKEVAKFE